MMIRFSLILALFLAASGLHGDSYSSSRDGFQFDLPPGYRMTEGRDRRFSFRNGQGSVFEIAVEKGPGKAEALLGQKLSRLGNGGEIEAFDYRGAGAALARLEFNMGGAAYLGWGLCLDRGEDLLLALAYGPGEDSQEIFHLSSLDSIAPTPGDRYYWGPVTEYGWPRGELRETPLYNSDVTALIGAGDAEAAQALVDREFYVLRQFEDSPLWQDAWRRFYRMILRDSWERLRDPLFQLERKWNAGAALGGGKAGEDSPGLSDRELAAGALSYVQGFRYERDLMGSDFVNLVSAVTEGRGDCDSRALLWALFLSQAGVDAGIMVSRDYGHAMGIADIAGPGARFPFEGKEYLVAETTAAVELGLIGKNVSETAKWMGVNF
ncbi:MAG: hypothetical protein LBP19_04345 [Treponema sp.]|jgi:hypothetical protein|nr:hypothetical protein [Treponema sp.]